MKTKEITKEKDGRKDSSGKDKALGIAIAQIEKNFGKGSIMKMGENKKVSIDAIFRVASLIKVLTKNYRQL